MITSFQKKDKFKNPILFPQKRGSRKKRIKKKMEERISMKEKKKEEEEKISTKQKDKKSKLNDNNT